MINGWEIVTFTKTIDVKEDNYDFVIRSLKVIIIVACKLKKKISYDSIEDKML